MSHAKKSTTAFPRWILACLLLSPLLFWWLYWLSAPGVAVALLGFVAVVMAFRAEQSSAKERAIWIIRT
jgi:MFS superfamily sulfate permease-like transporter